MKKICLFSLLTTSYLFAEGEAVKPTGYMNSLIMILLAIAFFYFILWRPEQKRRKAAKKRRDSLKVGDKVTAMGILGTIDKIEENTVIIKTHDGSKIEMLKMAITDVQNEEAPQETTDTQATLIRELDADQPTDLKTATFAVG